MAAETFPLCVLGREPDGRPVLVTSGGALGTETCTAHPSGLDGFPALDRIARRALAGGYRELWIHPSFHGGTNGNAGGELSLDWLMPAHPDSDLRPARALVPWYTYFRKGRPGELAISVPGADARARMFAETRDAHELHAAVRLFVAAMGTRYHHSPGATGASLMRTLHESPRARGLEAPPTPPPPATEARGVALDAAWRRPLSPTEARRTYLHAVDVNAMYLAACSALPLGVGPVRHLTGEELLADGAGLRSPLLGLTTQPGYWRVAAVAPLLEAAWPSAVLPPLFDVPRRARGGLQDGEAWITTPALKLLVEIAGLDAVRVREAYLWEETRRPLEPWYKTLRLARTMLLTGTREGHPGAAAALAAVKACYRLGIGYLGMRSDTWRTGENPLYRPDWRHMIQARARANLLRGVRRVWDATRIAPVAVATDALYYVADERDPLALFGDALKLDDQAGHYKLLATVRLDDLRQVLPDLDAGGSAASLRDALKVVAKEAAEEVAR